MPTGSEGSLPRSRPYYSPGPGPSETVQEDRANTMWSTYMKEAIEYDKFMTDGWRDDAKGFLMFVSPSPLV
jgi:hypothetical protein